MHIKSSAPYIKRGISSRNSMLNLLLCFAFILTWSVFLYGFRTLIVAAASVLSCVVAEYIGSKLARLPHSLSDFSAVVSGLIIAMLLPVTVPIWIICIMGFIAMLLAKAVFGGLGHNPFNPAACAIAFGTVAWPDYLLTFPMPFQSIPLFNPLSSTTIHYGQTVLASLKLRGVPSYRLSEIFYGAVPAAIGVSALLVIAASFFFLVSRRTVGWRMTLSFLTTVAVISMLFPRAGGPIRSVFYELSSGYLLFAAVFMITDPSTSPKSFVGRHLYGIVCGILTMLFRFFGTYSEGVCFAIIIANALSPTFDRLVIFLQKRRIEHGKAA